MPSNTEMQELVEGHQMLNRVIHRYLRAYGAHLMGAENAFDGMDNKKLLGAMNEEIFAEVQKRNPNTAMAISETEFLTRLEAAETGVEVILQNTIPKNLERYGSLSLMAILLYRVVTSLWTQIVLLLFLLLLITKLWKGSDKCVILEWLWKSLMIQGFLWAVIIPLGVKAAGSTLLGIVDRLLGRSMFLEVTPLIWRGGSLVGLGLLILLLSLRWKK